VFAILNISVWRSSPSKRTGEPFCKGLTLVTLTIRSPEFPLQDLIFGASVYFPPIFKAVLLGFMVWLVLHRLLRDWMYAGDIWHPILMDLSLFVIAISLSLGFLIMW
jgi:hypothetical protein